MSARPWFKFYPDNWRADAALRMCSPAARCLWIEMLCIMCEAQPCGHLLVKGHTIDAEQLAVQVGMALAVVADGLADLERHEVFSRTPDGVIYSRKMVRDARKSDEQRRRVATRWSAENADEIDPGNTGSIPKKPDTRSQKPEAATPSATQPLRGLEDWPQENIMAAFTVGVAHPWFDPSKIVSPKFHAQAPGYFSRWRGAGCSWLKDVLPVASTMAPTAGGPIQSLKFFDGAILSALAARTAPIDTNAPHRGGRYDGKLASKIENYGHAVVGARRVAARERDNPGGGFGGD